MTTQITVRLPDENVAWLDAQVAAGRFPSRTLGLAKLLSRAQRRQEDEADMLKILAHPDPDADTRLDWMRTRQYPSIDDDLTYDDTEHTAAAPGPGATAKAAGARQGTTASGAGRSRISAPTAAAPAGRRTSTATTAGNEHQAKTPAGAAAKTAGPAGRRAAANRQKANGTTTT